MGLEIGIEWLTVLLFGGLALLLALGLPMAFCTGSLATIFLYLFGSSAVLNMMPSRIFPFMTDYQLSAVPLFIGLAVAVSAGILVWLRRLPAKGQGLLAAGLSLILGGALGNVIDRVLHGYVIDFIRVHYEEHYFPAFNVADSAITIGAILIVLDNLLELDRSRAAKKKAAEGRSG